MTSINLITPKILTLITILVTLSLLPVAYGNAASIRQVTMDEMLQQCQFVFEGQVLTIEAKENAQKRIHTFVTFAIQEIIKGEYHSDTITLSFLGGTVGDVTMGVSDMQYPQVGEHGIYFVESLDRVQVHPLYGWDQGHFLVEADNTGTDRVMTLSKQPVTEVLGDSPAKLMNSSKEPGQPLSSGVAKGLSLALETQDSQGMTTGDFKKALRTKLGVADE
ncbi:MAG: hypothetical protein HGA96_12545 [Desulfobulbaceae bacterium]|nr:hypothetical protein [Desulfobulbaceae bacterium]